MTAAIAPPRSAAPTFVTFEIANWSENSSLRCSALLRSMRNGDWTTKNAWLAAPIAAARRRIAAGSVVKRRPAIASVAPPAPPASTRRRPNLSARMLAGKAASTPAADPAVPVIPMNAGSNPSAVRYRLKSTHQRLSATPKTSVVRRKIRASRSNPVKLRA